MPKQKVKKIDIHVHATSWTTEIQPPHYGTKIYKPTAEDLLPMLDEAGIEKAVLLPLCSSECRHLIITSEDVYNIAKNYGNRFYWFCGLDPRQIFNNEKTDLSFLIMHYKKFGAKGIGELIANLYADEPLMDNLFYHCQECDMPVLIHISPPPKKPGQATGCYGIIDDLGLPRLEKILIKYPKLKIIGHSQPFWAEISSDVTEETRNSYPSGKVKEGRLFRLLRDYENLYCDLSANSGLNAMERDKESAVKFLNEFSDRVMFGTDICSPANNHHLSLSKFYDDLYDEDLISETVYKKICRENAIRILKLD